LIWRKSRVESASFFWLVILQKRRPGNGAAFFVHLSLALVVFALFTLLFSLGLAFATTLAFKILVSHSISNGIVRIVAAGLFFVVALIGVSWGAITMMLETIFYTPTATHSIDGSYYFTQQE
jgi:hypothetical protein